MTTPEILEMLAEYYGKSESLTDRTKLVYLKTLSDIPSHTLEDAAYRWIKQGEKPYFPKVVELRQMAERVEARPPDFQHRIMAWRAMEAFFKLDVYDDGRYKRYFHAPEEPPDWWAEMPPPARTEADLDERYPMTDYPLPDEAKIPINPLTARRCGQGE